MDRCPVCSAVSLTAINEVRTFRSVSGEYVCQNCGNRIKAQYLNGGSFSSPAFPVRQLVYWHPACPRHGIDPVVAEPDGSMFTCMVCWSKMEAVDGKLFFTLPPWAKDPVSWHSVAEQQ